MVAALGFIGLGAMGSRLARRMAHGGPPLVVHDRAAAAVTSLLGPGVSGAGSPKDVGAAAEIVFLCLPSLEAGEDVILGENGIVHGDRVRTVVDFSTTGSAFAAMISDALGRRGIGFVAAPVSGGLAGAEAGTLAVIAAGPAETFAQVRPYLAKVGTHIFYFGAAPGLAQTMKLVNNVLSSTAFAVTCEALVLGTTAGLDPDMMVDVFNASTGRNSATLGKVPKAILPRKFDHGSKTSITSKDVDLCLAEAAALGVSMSVAAAAQKLWTHAMDEGAAAQDNTTLIIYLERAAGVVVRGAWAR